MSFFKHRAWARQAVTMSPRSAGSSSMHRGGLEDSFFLHKELVDLKVKVVGVFQNEKRRCSFTLLAIFTELTVRRHGMEEVVVVVVVGAVVLVAVAVVVVVKVVVVEVVVVEVVVVAVVVEAVVVVVVEGVVEGGGNGGGGGGSGSGCGGGTSSGSGGGSGTGGGIGS